MTPIATSLRASVHSAICGAIFGAGRSARRSAQSSTTSLDQVHDLTQQFTLAAPMGGGAMLAVQALHAQVGHRGRRSQ